MISRVKFRPERRDKKQPSAVEKLCFTKDKILALNGVSHSNSSFFIAIPIMPITCPNL